MAYTKLHFTYKTYQRKALYHLFNKGKIILKISHFNFLRFLTSFESRYILKDLKISNFLRPLNVKF